MSEHRAAYRSRTHKNRLPLNWGIPFFYLVAAIGSNLGRFAALVYVQSKQARGFG